MRHFFKTVYWLGFAAILSLAMPLFAQSEALQTNVPIAKPAANVGMPHQILVTGCLKRGNQADTFVIADQNGTSWELVSGSSAVDLSKHIFHAVRITGKEVPSSQKPESSAQSAPSDTTHHELRVLTLQVLSRSCTR